MTTNPKVILGFDPGRDKCGVAIQNKSGKIIYHQIITSETAIHLIEELIKKYEVDLIVMGDRTTAKYWLERLQSQLIPSLSIVMVDENNSTLEARDRYWVMYPPQGLTKLIPQGLRVPPRPVDDIVAIILIERYFAQ